MNQSDSPLGRLQTTFDSNPAELWADADGWNAIAGGVPFRRTEWLAPWWRHFGENLQAGIVTVRRGGALIGALPLCRRRGSRTWQSMAGERTCTDYVSVLCRPADRDEVTAAIADHLVARAGDRTWGWRRLKIDGVVAGDRAVGDLLGHLQNRRCGVSLTSQTHAWVNVCEPTWESFVASRGKRLRYLLRSAIRLNEKHPGLTYQVAQTVDQVREFADATIELHQARWRQSGEPGSFGTAAARAMIDDAVMAMHAAGRLHLATLHSDGQIIAGGIHFIGDDGRLYCYATGVNHDCPISAGTTLNAFVLRHAHEIGSPAVDLMRGDEPYKDRLQCHPTPVLEVTVAAPTLQGQIQSVVDQAGFAIKQRVRNFRKRPRWNTPTIAGAFGPEHEWLLPTLEADDCPERAAVEELGAGIDPQARHAVGADKL